MRLKKEDDSILLPNYVKGDLDSILPDTRKFVSEHGEIELIFDPNQDTTDLQKCLSLARDLFEKKSKKSKNSDNKEDKREDLARVIALGGLGGNFSHEMANIQALFLDQHNFASIVLVSQDNVATLLTPNTTHHILVPKEGCACSMIPIGTPCEKVTTTGLQWNVGE